MTRWLLLIGALGIATISDHSIAAEISKRADACRRRANDCELAASRVKDPDVRAAHLSHGGPGGVEWLRSKMLSITS